MFFFKFNQVIYSSSPISSPSFKPLAQIADKFKMPKFSKGHDSGNKNDFLKKFNQFSRYLADKFKMPKFSKDHNPGKINVFFF